MPPQPQAHRPVTRAKNATQHPGQIVINAQQIRRGTEEMAKVRAQECLNRGLTEQRTRAALKSVARIQDQQQTQDIEGRLPVLAPSLRRHETLMLPAYADPSVADNDKEMDGSDGEAAALTGEGDTEEDEDTSDMDDIEEEGQHRKKRKRGDGMRALIETMRKHPRENSKKPTAILVTPFPALKGKKPRARALASYVLTSQPAPTYHADNCVYSTPPK
jgi:hypothetical protein